MKISGGSDGPARLIQRLKSRSNHGEKAKLVRELKNQIIGNRTKKLTYLNHGAAAVVAGMIRCSGGSETDVESREAVLIQCGAVLGSLACGLDAGVEAVADAGGLPILMELVSSSNEKVADVGARSLKLIYRSKHAPKIDFLNPNNVEFLISLLKNSRRSIATNSVNLGAQLIAHSCNTPQEQQHLADSGVLKLLAALLLAEDDIRVSALRSVAALVRNNPKVAKAFVEEESDAVNPLLIRLAADRRNPRTRLCAAICLVNLRNSAKTCLGVEDDDLIEVLVETIDDDVATSDESALALCDVIGESDDPKFVVDRLFDRLKHGSVSQNRMRGIVLALFQICTKLHSKNTPCSGMESGEDPNVLELGSSRFEDGIRSIIYLHNALLEQRREVEFLKERYIELKRRSNETHSSNSMVLAIEQHIY